MIPSYVSDENMWRRQLASCNPMLTESLAATYDQTLSSNRRIASVGRNRAGYLAAMPAMSSPRRIISTSAAA